MTSAQRMVTYQFSLFKMRMASYRSETTPEPMAGPDASYRHISSGFLADLTTRPQIYGSLALTATDDVFESLDVMAWLMKLSTGSFRITLFSGA